MQQLTETLKSNLASKAVRNVQRGYTEDEKGRGLFRPEIKLDLQRSRLMTESFKETDGQAMVLRRAKALAHALDNMGIFIRGLGAHRGVSDLEPGRHLPPHRHELPLGPAETRDIE